MVELQTYQDKAANLNLQARKESEKQPMIILDELQRFTAQVGKSVHRIILSCVLHKSDFCGRVARRKTLFAEIHKKSVLQFAAINVRDTVNMWKNVI